MTLMTCRGYGSREARSLQMQVPAQLLDLHFVHDDHIPAQVRLLWCDGAGLRRCRCQCCRKTFTLCIMIISPAQVICTFTLAGSYHIRA